MVKPKFLNSAKASYSLDCTTCQDAEAEKARREDRCPDLRIGALSEGGNNLTRRQASFHARVHLVKNPSHEMHWTAMGRATKGE